MPGAGAVLATAVAPNGGEVENNIVENADVGLLIDAGVVGVLEHGNVFKQVKEPIKAPAGVMHRVSEGD